MKPPKERNLARTSGKAYAIDSRLYVLLQRRWCDIRHCGRSRLIHVVLKDKRRSMTHVFALSNGVGANESLGKHLAGKATIVCWKHDKHNDWNTTYVIRWRIPIRKPEPVKNEVQIIYKPNLWSTVARHEQKRKLGTPWTFFKMGSPDRARPRTAI